MVTTKLSYGTSVTKIYRWEFEGLDKEFGYLIEIYSTIARIGFFLYLFSWLNNYLNILSRQFNLYKYL